MKRTGGTLRAIALLLAAGALLLAGCAGRNLNRPGPLDEYPLPGMVYDEDNQPCAGAWIRVDGRDGPQSDLRGRFVILGLKRGVHSIEVEKEGYEPLAVAVDFIDRNQVLYLKVTSLAQLLRRAEQELEARRVGRAEELLERAERLYDADPVLLYLKAVLLLETDREEEALRSLRRILDGGRREAVVYLTMADIYQYRLQDYPRAAGALEEYLKLQKDPEVQQRLYALREQATETAGAAPVVPPQE